MAEAITQDSELITEGIETDQYLGFTIQSRLEPCDAVLYRIRAGVTEGTDNKTVEAERWLSKQKYGPAGILHFSTNRYPHSDCHWGTLIVKGKRVGVRVWGLYAYIRDLPGMRSFTALFL